MFEILLVAATCKMLKRRRQGILNVTAQMNISAREATLLVFTKINRSVLGIQSTHQAWNEMKLLQLILAVM